MQGIWNLRKRLDRIESDLNMLFQLMAQVTSDAFINNLHNAGVWVVDDIAALRAVSTQPNNRIAFVGTTESRVYRWTVPMAQVDDGVTYIRPDDYSGDGWVLTL